MPTQDRLKVLGQRLQKLRLRKGWSQEFLADRTGLDRSYLSGVENGYKNISFRNIEALADSLDTSLDRLFKRL